MGIARRALLLGLNGLLLGLVWILFQPHQAAWSDAPSWASAPAAVRTAVLDQLRLFQDGYEERDTSQVGARVAVGAARERDDLRPVPLMGRGPLAFALACVFTFAIIGRGTPAPFDPPGGVVVRGPYRRVRNPMYIGAGLTLFGAALYYQSLALLAYTLGFLAAAHLFVVLYEEPTLRRTFGREYDAYCRHAGRWWPRH